MTTAPDEPLGRLAVRAAGGDADAFRQLAEAVAGQAHRLAWRILADSQLAGDAVQEFLIKLAGALPGYDPGRDFRPWARSIAARTAIDLLRREKAWRDVPLEAAPDLPGPATDRPDHRLEADQAGARIREAADSLPDRQRTIFVLRDLEEWTTAEIAAHLDMAESTVRVHLARARARMREALGADGGAGGDPC